MNLQQNTSTDRMLFLTVPERLITILTCPRQLVNLLQPKFTYISLSVWSKCVCVSYLDIYLTWNYRDMIINSTTMCLAIKLPSCFVYTNSSLINSTVYIMHSPTSLFQVGGQVQLQRRVSASHYIAEESEHLLLTGQALSAWTKNATY